jgi:Mg-chelatase subunit ChlD
MSEAREFDFLGQVDHLYECRKPLLIGVRHHSAAITRALAPLLETFQPKSILLEMPSDFSDWIEHLADEQTVAPVAISAADPQGNISFYPLADFSPELAAIRWANKHRVPIVPMDLSAGAHVVESKRERLNQAINNWIDQQRSSQNRANEASSHSSLSRTVLQELLARTHSEDTGQLWERLIETPGMLYDAESVRRASLLFGWAVREHGSHIQPRDLLRESAMRQAIREAPEQSIALIGSFHATALLPPILDASAEHDQFVLDLIREDTQRVGVSLVGYSFEQLDERSGYPAGIRDPVWHDRMFASENFDQMDAVATELIVDICRAIRSRGHVAGTPDATEITRMMRDLAKIRALPMAGRGELIESIQSCLLQGELHGRAREVARAVESVLIGNRKGRVTDKAPRCGLSLAMDEVFRSLKLPTTEVKEIRLDVLRDERDRARAVVLRQLCAANIPYARRVDTIEQGNRENLIEVWEVGFRQGTNATLESVARFGVTLVQVVEGILQLRSPNEGSDDWTPALLIHQFTTASECGLHGLTRRAIEQLSGSFLKSAGLSELVEAASRIGRIAAGHVPGLPQPNQEEYPPYLTHFHCEQWVDRLVSLIRTSLDRLSGLVGSNEASDVVGLCELGHWLRGSVQTIGSMASDRQQLDILYQGMPQLISWCHQTSTHGSDRMRGASVAMLCLLHEKLSADLASLMTGWIDDARDQRSRGRLRDALAGTVQVLLPMMQSEPEWLGGMQKCFQVMSDDEFLKRLPSLRGAFHEFSPADRQRVLDVQLEMLTDRGTKFSLGGLSDDGVVDANEALAILRAADLAGQSAVQSLFPKWIANLSDATHSESSAVHETDSIQISVSYQSISIADRWRMVLGVPPDPKSLGCQAARSLDHLYGEGKGEGARSRLSKRRPGSVGGTEQPVPTAAEWAEDLESLFGSDICQEVLGSSAASGNLGALTALDPDTVIPSMELLQQVLSMAGGTSESKTQRLRQIAKRITEQLAQKLAVRLRPHIHGLSIARPTRRRNRRLNLARTIRGNLANAVRREDGRTTIVAKDLIFHSASKREMDWHLTFVVDVSGSMTSSVVYSALCAAIFAELPALSIRFLAFSTQVVDLSGHVCDPLALLLEVQVGGGTHIGLGLRHARAGLRVPTRSMVVLVTDFEEGVSTGEMIAETRALVESGVKCIGLAALDDQGVARFHQGCAQMMASAGMPIAAVSPEKLAQWVGDQIRGI